MVMVWVVVVEVGNSPLPAYLSPWQSTSPVLDDKCLQNMISHTVYPFKLHYKMIIIILCLNLTKPHRLLQILLYIKCDPIISLFYILWVNLCHLLVQSLWMKLLLTLLFDSHVCERANTSDCLKSYSRQ